MEFTVELIDLGSSNSAPGQLRWPPLLAFAVLLPAACGEPEHHRPNLMDHPNRQFVEAGNRYQLEFAEPVDAYPVNQVWTGAALTGSPLSYMMRPALILKADDFGGAINANAARFIELADAYGAIVSPGIITSGLKDRAPVNRTYSDLHGLGFEAWFHGHTHNWSSPTAEFSGVGVDEQQESFETGIELGRAKLGVDFHSFGAPGNNIDDNIVLTKVEQSTYVLDLSAADFDHWLRWIHRIHHPRQLSG